MSAYQDKDQHAIKRIQTLLSRKRRIRDALRDYRRVRELTGRGYAWPQVKSAMKAFGSAPLTRVQLRRLLIREAYPFFERVAKQRNAAVDTAAAMTADFLGVAFPHLCDDVTTDRVRALIRDSGRERREERY